MEKGELIAGSQLEYLTEIEEKVVNYLPEANWSTWWKSEKVVKYLPEANSSTWRKLMKSELFAGSQLKYLMEIDERVLSNL